MYSCCSNIPTSYTEKRVKQVEEKLDGQHIGIKTGGLLILMIRLADDIVLIAKAECDLQRALVPCKLS